MTPGYHVMRAETYHSDPAAKPSLSNSIAKILLDSSPRKAWFSHPRLNSHYREVREDKFDMGTACHAVLLENDASKIVVVEAEDWRTKVAKEQRDAARAAGKTPLLARHYVSVRKMADAALAFIAESEIAEYWNQAESELTAVWEEDGTWLRCRFDRISLNRRCVIDYKSTGDASPDVFGRQILRMGYHLQDAFYRRAIRNIEGKDPAFVFLAQSDEPPYECSLHGCDPALREIADAQVEVAVQTWRDCMESGKWPTYSGRIHWTVPPTYLMQKHEELLTQMESA